MRVCECGDLFSQTTVPPQSIGCTKFTEDALLRHAQFIVEQVRVKLHRYVHVYVRCTHANCGH